MKKLLLPVFLLSCFFLVGCNVSPIGQETLDETSTTKQQKNLSTQEILSLLKENAKGWAVKFRNNSIPMDQEGYYKLSIDEQKDLFFLQHETINPEFYIPKFSYMEAEVVSGGYCVIQEDEGTFPLSYQGTLKFYSDKVRYPFPMITKFFKDFSLHGVVESGEVTIKIVGKFYNSDSNSETTQIFDYKAGESFIINPWLEFTSSDDIKQFNIYITGKENSKLNYSFDFKDNS